MEYASLCNYLENKPGSRRDMPFGADTLVFKVLNKMFALVAWQSDPLKVSLKSDPVDAVILCKQYAAVNPGYHLNKKHWITVTLDGSIPDAELRLMMDDSYTLVVQGMTLRMREQLKKIGWQNHGKAA